MSFTDNDAQRLLNIIDERIERKLKETIQFHWGTVSAVTTTTKECSVSLHGDVNPSGGFKYFDPLLPAVGNYVMVAIGPSGDRWVVNIAGSPLIRIDNANDVSLTSTGHPFQIGPTSGGNIAMDGNEIIARSNGAVSDLYLQNEGGKVAIGVNNGDLTSGLEVIKGGIRVGTTVDPGVHNGINLGGDVVIYRGAANVFTLASGDRFDAEAVAEYTERTTTVSVANASWTKVTGYTFTSYQKQGVTSTSGEFSVPTAGLYLFIGSGTWAGNATGRRILGFGQNNSNPGTASVARAMNSTPGNANTWQMQTFVMAYLSATDTMALWAYQDSGGSLNLNNCSVGIVRLGV